MKHRRLRTAVYTLIGLSVVALSPGSKAGTICSNGVCETGENACTCPMDCVGISGDLDCSGHRGLEDAIIILQEQAGLIDDLDNDGFQSGVDCDDADPLVYPGATELCDGKDNDCNGVADDAVADQSCYTGPPATADVGLCRNGSQTCTSGNWTTCQGEVVPQEEDCDCLDNNCNTLVDEELSDWQSAGITTCPDALRSCSACEWLYDYSSVPSYEENETSCDGLDNDCDGQVDESC